jgi:hypothetical protein
MESETYEYTQMYPGMAKTAREEGFVEVAQWFETLAKAERSHCRPVHQGPRGPSGAIGRCPPTPRTRPSSIPRPSTRSWSAFTSICAGCRRCHSLCPSFDYMLEAVDHYEGDVCPGQARGVPPDRRPVLAVQALLQPLPVHAAAPLRPRLPAADPAGQGGARGRGRRHAQDSWLGNVDAVGASDPPPRPSATGPTASGPTASCWRPWWACTGTATCRGSTTRRSPGGSASAERRGRAKGTVLAGRGSGRSAAQAKDRALLFLLGELPRAARSGATPSPSSRRTTASWPARPRSAAGCRTWTAGTWRRPPPTPGGTSRPLAPLVEAGAQVIVPQPTCSYVLKKEYPMLAPGEAADKVAGRHPRPVRVPRDAPPRGHPVHRLPRAGPRGRSPTRSPATCAPRTWASRPPTSSSSSPAPGSAWSRSARPWTGPGP